MMDLELGFLFWQLLLLVHSRLTKTTDERGARDREPEKHCSDSGVRAGCKVPRYDDVTVFKPTVQYKRKITCRTEESTRSPTAAGSLTRQPLPCSKHS